MSHLTLHAQQIRKLTLTKQHIASIAWELDLYSMQTLSASAYRVWHFIRAYAAFDIECYSTKLSQEYIAEKLKCSVKTISRAIGEIKEAGLMEVQGNVSKTSGTQANTYFITFPKEAYAQAEETSDKVVKFTSSQETSHPDTVIISASASPIDIEQKAVMVTSMPLKEEIMLLKHLDQVDKVDHTPSVKSDVAYSDYNFIEKNNKIVVFDLCKHEEKEENLSSQQAKLTTLLTQLQDKRQNLMAQLNQCSSLKSTNDRLSLLKNTLNNRLDANTMQQRKESSLLLKKLNDLDSEIEQLSKQFENIDIELKKQRKTELLHKDPSFVNKIEGERQLSEEDLQMILTKLKTLNVTQETRNQLVNEVIYETRFGSLVKNNQTQEHNPIKRSINIGCKLIRAGQWCRPTRFDQVYAQA